MTSTTIPTVDAFTQTPRRHQQLLIDDALVFLDGALSLAPGDDLDAYRVERSRLYSAPTGTGKGSAILLLARELRSRGLKVGITTPSIEVGRSFVERCGGDPTGTADAIAAQMRALDVWTPIRLRNALLRGEIRGDFDVMLIDEAHHAIAANESGGTLFALIPDAAWIGFTATPFRASPRATAELRAAWGEPVLVCDLPQAVDLGFCSMPSVSIRPLVDDDQIKLSSSGEFEVESIGDATRGRIDDLVALLGEYVSPDPSYADALRYDRPTLLILPTVALCEEVARRGLTAGVPIAMVTGDTPHSARAGIYSTCRERYTAIATVAVIAEGVDLPWLRRLVDAKPCMSPVLYLQQIGRIMRPVPDGEAAPELIVTNRNLERNGYLFEGIIPRETIAECQTAFGGPSARGAMRHLGLHALRRFRTIPLPLADGSTATMFNLYRALENGSTEEICVISVPGQADPLVARRENGRDTYGRKTWGSWARYEIPAEGMTGFATSQQRSELSAKQRAWWERSGRRFGLDPTVAASLTRRQFAALPVLADLRLRINVGGSR